MKLMRIDLSAWTSSFRYPNLISGIQPTLDVPPVSTVLGLLNAAAGRYLLHEPELRLGYYFEYASRGWDMETIYQIESNNTGKPTNNAKSNVIQREFLFEGKLSIYLEDLALAHIFEEPIFPLLLGRSCDLATVDAITEVELPKVTASKVVGQVIPFTGNYLPGKIQALPRYFSDTFPRRNLGTEPYSIISFDGPPEISTKLSAFRDSSKGKSGVDIYLHQIKMAELY
ncbi:MAG: type I-B CRISPR-associated protein Cas5b [Saprospiraceae bacterium]